MNDGLLAVLVHVLVHADLPHFMCGKLKRSNTTGPTGSAEDPFFVSPALPGGVESSGIHSRKSQLTGTTY